MARRRLLDTVTASLAAASLLARAPAVLAQPERAGSAQAREAIAANATPFSSLGSPEFSSVIDRYADARAILLGQSTHGTKELYRARAALTARLVREHGFNIIAVEADLAGCRAN